MNKNEPVIVASQFVPTVIFPPEARGFINKHLVTPRCESFLAHIAPNIESIQLNSGLMFTNVDWSLEKIYKCLGDLNKQETGELTHRIRYFVTHDEDLTPIQLDLLCPIMSNQIKYGRICFGRTPICYFIYVGLQEMLTFVKQNHFKIPR